MRIGIPTVEMDHQPVGVGNYAYNLLKELIRISDSELTFIHLKKNNNDLYKKVNETIVTDIPKIPISIKINGYLSFVKRNEFDLVHYLAPGFTFPAPFKKVMTVHDLAIYSFPETARNYWSKQMIKIASYRLKSMDKIITISFNTKADIEKYSKVPKEKIEVIYPGICEKFTPSNNRDICKDFIKRKYNFDTEFILSVSTLQPRKNIQTLIRAYYKLKKKYNSNLKVIIVGKKGWKYTHIEEIVKKMNLEKYIIFTDYVPEEILPIFYNAAELFVFPSLYEGFGFPPLEAMACGTPVICSNSSSLPEVVGDAGILIDPYDINGFVEAMHEILTNESLRDDLIGRGLNRAKMFTWKQAAEETMRIYKEVVES